jgi:uncharacterized protein (DUF1501 family)
MLSRRDLLQGAGAWASLMALGQAQAQTVSGYKALVCVFLAGGNDAYNTLLRTDSSSWQVYTTVRNQQPSSIALLPAGAAPDASKTVGSPEFLGGVLPLSSLGGEQVAFHPKLTRLAALFNTDRKLAVLSNVGPLVNRLTKSEYEVATSPSAGLSQTGLPKKLFSHNDQQNTWMAMAPEGVSKGWGGKLMDGLNPNNRFAAVTVAGNSVWLTGVNTRQYQLSTNGAIAVGGSTVYGSSSVAAALKRITSNGLAGPSASSTPRSSHVLMADLGAVGQRSIDAEAVLTSALASLPPTDTRIGPDARLQYTNSAGAQATNSLAVQLQTVARMIGIRSALGPARQVFFVQLGGFDTHDNQNSSHAELLARLDHGLAYFYESLKNLGVQDAVTTFTASEFGRSFTSNGDGTDHGWGGHHFILGGAVKGGRVYGSLPAYGLKSATVNTFDSPNQLFNGVLLPTTSVDQYAATLGKWFGVSGLNVLFPNLSGFATSDLGFMV